MKAALGAVLVAVVVGALYFAMKQPDPNERDKPTVTKKTKESPKRTSGSSEAPSGDDREEVAEAPSGEQKPPAKPHKARATGLEIFESQRSTGEPVTPTRPWGGLEPVGLPSLAGVKLHMDHKGFASTRPKVRHIGGDPEKSWVIDYEEIAPMKGVTRVTYQFNRSSIDEEPFLNSLSVQLDEHSVGGPKAWEEMMEKVAEAGWGPHEAIMEETDRRRATWRHDNWIAGLSVHRETGKLVWHMEFTTPPQ